MNLTQPSTAPLPSIFDLVRKEAGDRGVNVLESEIVGLLPRFSLGAEPPERINWRDFRAEQIIENWLPHP
jgi:glutamate formiminotransferase